MQRRDSYVGIVWRRWLSVEIVCQSDRIPLFGTKLGGWRNSVVSVMGMHANRLELSSSIGIGSMSAMGISRLNAGGNGPKICVLIDLFIRAMSAIMPPARIFVLTGGQRDGIIFTAVAQPNVRPPNGAEFPAYSSKFSE